MPPCLASGPRRSIVESRGSEGNAGQLLMGFGLGGFIVEEPVVCQGDEYVEGLGRSEAGSFDGRVYVLLLAGCEQVGDEGGLSERLSAG